MSSRHWSQIHTAKSIDEALTAAPRQAEKDYRAVVIEGKTPSEQAAERGVTPSTVNQNVQRAVKHVRRQFEGNERDPLNDVYVERAVGLYLEPERWFQVIQILNAAADIRLENAAEVDAKSIRYMARLLTEQLNNRRDEDFTETNIQVNHGQNTSGRQD